jgi:hypothetical protein
LVLFLSSSPGAGDIAVRQKAEDKATNSGAKYQDEFVQLLRKHFPSARFVVSFVLWSLVFTDLLFCCYVLSCL